MRRVLGWLFVVFLCCAAGEDAGVAPPDPRLAEATTFLAEAKKHWQEGRYAEAIPAATRALALREAALGEAHPEVAACLNTLGGLYRQQGAFAQAEPLYLRALDIRLKVLGEKHASTVASLVNLANLYADQGLYGRAEPLYQRALAIDEEVLGKSHEYVAADLNGLASLYNEQDLYSQAEPLFLRALAIQEETLGKTDPLVAATLNNLGILYFKQGLYSRAEALQLRALAIREAMLSPNHPDLAITLTNLANLYTAQGLYSRAEPLYLRAIAVKEKALGPNHPSVAHSLNNLALLYHAQGLDARATPLFQRTLALFEEAFGKHHPMVANALNNLADAYRGQGMYRRAEPVYPRALAVAEATLGPRHAEVSDALTHMALLRLAQQRLSEALPLLARALSISEQHLRRESLGFSDSRLASFLLFLRQEEERLYALLRAHPGNASVQRLALAAALLRKGRSVEELSNTSRTLQLSLSPQDREAFERLRELRTQLAALSLQGPGTRSPAGYQQHLKELADQGDALEADLAQRSAPLRALSALPSPEDIVGRVASSLPKDGALVEFVAYEDRPLVPKPGTPEGRLPSQLRYLALVLFPDASIRALDLGPAAPIDSAVSRLRDALSLRDAAYQPPSQALYALSFKPLRPLLASTRRLFLAPDGQLSLVPFAALHDGKHFLLDSFDISYLTSGKDLLPRPEQAPSTGPVVVLADPAFTTLPSASASPAPPPAQRSSSLERFFSTLRADMVEHSWPPLPGTRREAEAIQHLLPEALLYLGPDASKQRLLQLRSPSVLHIATHGFFLENAAPPTPAGSRALGAVGSTGVPSQLLADPLLRSGLVLSGASALASSPPGTAPLRPDAALVTALELTGMDLWGTQLVVLSACDTGRGDVKLGQGVYGLRRALVIAGAETLVMSLWKVNDDSTRLLMEHFYQGLMAGQGRAAALRGAMLAVRQQLPHPYSWAPFISLGSDAPLRSLASLPTKAE